MLRLCTKTRMQVQCHLHFAAKYRYASMLASNSGKTPSGSSEHWMTDHSLAGADPGAVSELLRDSFLCRPEESMWHIAKIQDSLIWLHDTAGLPWWATIGVLTVGLRTIMLPVNISLVRNSAKLNQLRPELGRLGQVMRDESTNNERKDDAAQTAIRLLKHNRCSPFRNILAPIFMTPVFLSVFTAWERLILFTPEMRHEGALWFDNLAATDMTYLLPVLSALTWIWTFRLGADRARSQNAIEFERFASYMSLAMIPVTSTLPAGTFLYWLSSNLFSLGFMVFTRNAHIRRLLRIPPKVSPKKYDWDL